MEAHPIPQNVTTFQFHLVGDMTLKQFFYLAVGLVIAYVNFVFVASPLPLLAWPIIIISALLGIAFAFLPIGDRPLDHWLGAFLKAVYSPTKLVWEKSGKNYREDPLFIRRLDLYAHAHSIQATEPAITVIPRIQPNIASTPQPQAIIQALPITHSQPAEKTPSTEELSKTVELARQAQNLQVQIVQTQKKLNTIRTDGGVEEINQILAGLNQLVGQASQIKQQLATVTHEPPQIPIQPAKVQVVASVQPKTNQIILTTTPNVINGISSDSSGNYLEGVVVVIYDKDGLPVRALKTNKLGQFSGATPLPDGKYNIQLEKDNLSFDILQVTLDNRILPPLMIAAKKLL
ncbi:MAG: PrgI family protein [Candidatus Daviesbacteria bacterium]|nr:PrgI family protein [Candidatus Daviesbacteria bacterium]